MAKRGKDKKVPSHAEILAARAKEKKEAVSLQENQESASAADSSPQKNGVQSSMMGKLMIAATLKLETGLHIGSAKDFAPIGAVDSPFIRDSFTKQPVIPGSSLKGKMRTLLARSMQTGYWLNEIDSDPEEIKRLFGARGSAGSKMRCARLQFFDIRMTEESFRQFNEMELDTYIGEIKFENVISRLTAEAKPRQIERVPAGTEFAFRLAYNIERENEVMADMKLLADGLKLLQMDYLGGSGSRGYGRLSLRDFAVDSFALKPERISGVTARLEEIKKVLEGSRFL